MTGSRTAARQADAIDRARSALRTVAHSPEAIADPLLVIALKSLEATERPLIIPGLLDSLLSRSVSHGRENPRRYRWGLSWRSEPGSLGYALEPGVHSVNWRPAEQHKLAEDPSAYGRRLMEPIVLASQFGFWGDVAADVRTDPQVAGRANALLDEATPNAEADLSQWFAALDPWRDTLALWLLSRESHAVARLRDLLFSLAIRYGGIAARDGVVLGTKHPFYREPLVSASAQLASGLWAFGVYPTVVPALTDFVRESRGADGGWADGGQPTDVMTTLAAADLLIRLDPGFDPSATVDFFLAHQEPAGWWRALNPEVPWLTAAVVDWLRLAERPFAERFAWPASPIWARDRLSGLTTMATLDELESLLRSLPNLRDAQIDAAFLDLAGFGAWNTAHGQMKGDEVIALLGRSLNELEGVLAVRLGGDEFLMLGKPGSQAGSLEALLDTWSEAWPSRLQAIGAHGVAPRIVVGAARTGDLRGLRRELGEAIALLKAAEPVPPPEGVIRPLR